MSNMLLQCQASAINSLPNLASLLTLMTYWKGALMAAGFMLGYIRLLVHFYIRFSSYIGLIII